MNLDMTVLEDAATYATDPSLIAPLTAALSRAAVEISAEADTTPNHEARIALAHQVIQSPTAWAQSAFAWATSTDADLVAEWVADAKEAAQADMAGAIADVWDAVAGTLPSV